LYFMMNYKYLVLVVLWMASLFCLSSIPYLGHGIGGYHVQFQREFAHIIAYGILSFLMWCSFPKLEGNLFKKILVCAFLALLYAISDEVHQAFVPGRSGNIKGVVFDVIGIVAVLVWLGVRQRTVVRSRKLEEVAW
jgi:VanZ family protein